MAKEYFAKEEDIGILTDNINKKISSPNVVEVGQILSVKAVDDSGKPTEWEVVDKPGSAPGESSLYIYMTQEEYEALTEYEEDQMYWVTYPLTHKYIVWLNVKVLDSNAATYPYSSEAHIVTAIFNNKMILNSNITEGTSSGISPTASLYSYVEMTNNVESICDYAMTGNVNTGGRTEEIVTGINLKTIGSYAFKSLFNLKNIILKNKLEKLGNYVFEKCYNLTAVTIPDSVKTMGGGVFYNCNKLKSVIIGNGITELSSNTFQSCSALELIAINKPQDSVSGAPWGATNATVVWTG